MKWYESLYNYLTILSFIAYISILTGITFINEDLTNYITLGIKWYIALYLIIRYNPFFNKIKHEKRIIFNSGLYLLFSLIPYKQIKKLIQHYINV